MHAAPIPPLLLLGCGRMGSALLRGWQAQGLAASFVVDPVAVELAAPHRQVGEPSALPQEFRPAVIVLAVKPQMASAALPQVAHLAPEAAVLSIMAGRTLGGLTEVFPAGSAIVRAMPNLPAAIGQGVSVACAGAHVGEAARALCDRLLSAVGATAWTSDESLLDPVTAISGSGPAYVFLLAELLEMAGIEQGLPAEMARLLARRTIGGAAAMLEGSSEDAAGLRQAVTSPGGTTEQALAVLMREAAWPTAIRRAVEAATQRSRGLAR